MPFQNGEPNAMVQYNKKIYFENPEAKGLATLFGSKLT